MENNNNKVKVLISYDEKGMKAAGKYAEIYKKVFEVVFDKEANVFDSVYDRAKSEGMTHILHFIDDKNLLLSGLNGEMEYTLDITVDDLNKVLSQNA